MNRETSAFAWEDVIPTLIPNTVMKKRLNNGVATYYKIAPAKGYKLHTKELDEPIENDAHEQIGTKFGYTNSFTSCAITYDFTSITVADENGTQYIAYGSREFFAIPSGEVMGGE